MKNNQWVQLADKSTVEKTINSLKENNIEAVFVKDGTQAKNKVIEMIPKESEVLSMTSTTLEKIGLKEAIDESGKYVSIRKQYMALDMKTQLKEIKRLRSLPDWAVGSVHAVTLKGEVLIASAAGSQIPAYAYGAKHVVWVVGTHKIVKNINEGIKRIYEHCLPLENERVKKAYGWTGSSVNKILIFAKESKMLAGRTTLIFVDQALGF